MLSLVDIGQFLSGIGIFLFAMAQMEAALKVLGSRSAKKFLRRHTQNPLKSILGGALVTALLQSSSVVGLITLAFVGAGIIELVHALGIILGSNLGTTFTGWIVATLGFKLNLTDFYLYLFGLGCFGVISVTPDHKLFHFGRLTIGFGLLLMGLVLMKESMESLVNVVDLSVLERFGRITFFIGGLLFTAIIQSSSATMIITLSALNAGIIPLESAAALVVGADLGTTGTVLLGGLKGAESKKRVALAHLIFNLFTDLIALLILPWLLYLVTDVFGIVDPLFSLVAFHSCFNLIGIILFLPFLKSFTHLLQSFFPKSRVEVSQYIHNVPPSVTDAAISALDKEVNYLTMKVVQFNVVNLNLGKAPLQFSFPGSLLLQKRENNEMLLTFEGLKRLECEIIEYVVLCQSSDVESEVHRRLMGQLDRVRNAVFAAKSIEDIRQIFKLLEKATEPHLLNQYQFIQQQMIGIYQSVYRLLEIEQSQLSHEELLNLSEKIETFHDNLHQRIYEDNKIHRFSEVGVSTLFNINREIYLSNIYLLKNLESSFSSLALAA